MSRQRVERSRKHFGEMKNCKVNEERKVKDGSVGLLNSVLLGSSSALVV